MRRRRRRSSWGHKEREILTRTDGGESVQIDIFKEADANIVALAQAVSAIALATSITDAAPEPEDEDDPRRPERMAEPEETAGRNGRARSRSAKPRRKS